jgi:peptidase inhibitor family I36
MGGLMNYVKSGDCQRRRGISRIAAIAGFAVAATFPSVASGAQFLGPIHGVTHTRPATCPEWRLCLYRDGNFSGPKSLRREKTNPDWRLSHFENGQVMNDEVSSVFNSSPYRTKRLYRNTSFGSHIVCIAPRTGLTDMAQLEWIDYLPDPFSPGQTWPRRSSMQDRLSSHTTHDENIDALACSWKVK